MRYAAIAGLILLHGCAPTVAGDGRIEQGAAACDATKAQFAVGQSYSGALAGRARQAAGAKIVRRLVPGQVVTMEFSPERLNLETDDKGIVIAARCG